jgi:hypothetical protein
MDYDVRYLGGVRFFNDGDFFEAHEVWEGLWLETSGPERRFYQGLIQAAVALYHFGNGNLRGASGETVCLQEDLIPRIDLDPEPASWPEPTDFVDDDSKDR